MALTKASPPDVLLLAADLGDLSKFNVSSRIEAQHMDVVTLAENGVEAVELAAQHMPDLVLTDLKMPVVAGIEATRRIKQQHPISLF